MRVASAGSLASSTLNSPVGCSMDSVRTGPGPTTARPTVAEPGSTQAVATVTAASTPMATIKPRVLVM